MKTPLTRAAFVFCIVAIASSLVVLSTLSDVPTKQQIWTYDDEDEYFLNEWKDAGGGDFATAGFPPSLLRQFEIAERTIAPEIFFSQEFQRALFSSREPFSVMSDPLQSSRQYLDNLSGDREFSFSMENEKRKMAAISRVLNPDHLPREVLEGLELQRDHMARMNERGTDNFRTLQDLRALSSDSIDEAFHKLRPTDQISLEPYRQYLTDFPSILIVFERMSNLERQAASRLVSLAQYGDEGSFVLPPDGFAQTPRDVEREYLPRPIETAPTVTIQRAIEHRRMNIDANSLSQGIEQTEVIPLSSVEARAVSRWMSPVPDEYILPESENFLVRESGGDWRRYYSRTVFGGAVIVDESQVTSATVSNPNLLIAGRGAASWHERYESNHWVTKISAFNGVKQYRFVVDGKLEHEQITAFIEFCRQIAEDRH